MSKNGRPLIEYDHDRARQLLNEGFSVRKAALQLGVHHNTLQGHVNRGALNQSVSAAKLASYQHSYAEALENAKRELEHARANYKAWGERVATLADTVEILRRAVESNESTE